MYIDDPSTGLPARCWIDGSLGDPMPGWPAGRIAFGPLLYPTLAEVIEWLPGYEETLWTAVREKVRGLNIVGQLPDHPEDCHTFNEAEQEAGHAAHGH
ncbi:hypothetical protein ACFVMC_15290 [Nocardia sp. NPDC127579]|uniref:hypothetical protein n=1 Tax=Nocardia sp. NPDC127579 TaxID=3345402 RepID=UPI0036259320